MSERTSAWRGRRRIRISGEAPARARGGRWPSDARGRTKAARDARRASEANGGAMKEAREGRREKTAA
ncbi:hypothetical protein DP49_4048 [Burkholderia pseudomallei]|nr:hypothetical protein DP49_4048 [Burkholderia pseudomallei]